MTASTWVVNQSTQAFTVLLRAYTHFRNSQPISLGKQRTEVAEIESVFL